MRFQDRVFLVASDSDKMGDHGDSDAEIVDSLEDIALFVGKSNRFKGRTKEDRKGESYTKYRKKTCPIKCQQEVHSNGSLYFCHAFRNKSKDERRLFAKKCHVCITCLSRTNKCEIGPCKNCGAAHNILLSTKEVKWNDNVLRLNDLYTSTSGSEEDMDDCGLDTADSVLMAKGGKPTTSTPKSKSSHGQGKTDSKDGKDTGKKEGKKEATVQLNKVLQTRILLFITINLSDS